MQPPLSGQPESLHINRSGTYAIAWGVSDEVRHPALIAACELVPRESESRNTGSKT